MKHLFENKSFLTSLSKFPKGVHFEAGFSVNLHRYRNGKHGRHSAFILVFDYLFQIKNKSSIPWLSIMSSAPALVIFCGHFANNWADYTLVTMLPTFMANILHFNLTQVSKACVTWFVYNYACACAFFNL